MSDWLNAILNSSIVSDSKTLLCELSVLMSLLELTSYSDKQLTDLKHTEAAHFNMTADGWNHFLVEYRDSTKTAHVMAGILCMARASLRPHENASGSSFFAWRFNSSFSASQQSAINFVHSHFRALPRLVGSLRPPGTLGAFNIVTRTLGYIFDQNLFEKSRSTSPVINTDLLQSCERTVVVVKAGGRWTSLSNPLPTMELTRLLGEIIDGIPDVDVSSVFKCTFVPAQSPATVAGMVAVVKRVVDLLRERESHATLRGAGNILSPHRYLHVPCSNAGNLFIMASRMCSSSGTKRWDNLVYHSRTSSPKLDVMHRMLDMNDWFIICYRIFLACANVHACGLVHGDVKLIQFVMSCSCFCSLHLCDFGDCTHDCLPFAGHAHFRCSGSGLVLMNTGVHVAPELALLGNRTKASDVFACAAMACLLLPTRLAADFRVRNAVVRDSTPTVEDLARGTTHYAELCANAEKASTIIRQMNFSGSRSQVSDVQNLIQALKAALSIDSSERPTASSIANLFVKLTTACKHPEQQEPLRSQSCEHCVS
jgi:serine/threonine protein kinase